MDISPTEELLARAREHEGSYEWEKAAICYQRAAGDTCTSLEATEATMKSGWCYELATTQAPDGDAFADIARKAISLYQSVARGMDGTSSETPAPFRRAALAHSLALQSYMAQDWEERRTLIDKALEVQRILVEELERKGDIASWLKHGGYHLAILGQRLFLASHDDIQDVVREGATLGGKLSAASPSPELMNDIGWARYFELIYCLTAALTVEEWHNDLDRVATAMMKAYAADLLELVEDLSLHHCGAGGLSVHDLPLRSIRRVCHVIPRRDKPLSRPEPAFAIAVILPPM